MIASTPDRSKLWGYQLKSGNFSQADVTKHREQLNMLVETRPIFPGLPRDFEYQPVLVTTGEFKEPAVSLIKELNESWRVRNLPALELINGRALLADLLKLSADFWPVALPAARTLRSLYLVEGKGDFDPDAFSDLLMRLFAEKTGRNLGRQAAAANLFTSYLLGPFQENMDHWSVFRGWTLTAASIAWAGAKSNTSEGTWHEPYRLARDAAKAALVALHNEAKNENKFRSHGMEFDDYTRVRNVTAMAAAVCVELMSQSTETRAPDIYLARLTQFIAEDRLLFWGEGALSQHLMLIWFLEKHGAHDIAKVLLLRIITLVARKNQEGSPDPLPDGYTSPDDCLTELLSETSDSEVKKAVESHSLLALIILCARRQMRAELNAIWVDITHVRMSILRTEDPLDVLQWSADNATEHSQQFNEHSWRELAEFAFLQDVDRLLPIFQKDPDFALMYLLTFQHRMMGSLLKHLDEHFARVEGASK
ncbi:hypothetical protein [Lacunisphaera limnophila]|uniref:hypothetical protein n=1 Tax=Lacunisphaera limnophila TaxID=1838286 RepID=UPI0012FD1FF8|nr:hypothetical protein [Lacunisphaera limnophila]